MKKALTMLLCASISAFAANYSIIAPKAPAPYEQTAIDDLKEYLAKRIDGELSIGGENELRFHVGDTEFAKTQKCSSSELEDEQWVIRSVGKDILLNGGGTRGCLYAVYHFLEDFCDIHWWGEEEEYVPAASSLSLPALDKTGRPFFKYRDIVRLVRMGDAGYRFLTRNRLNNDSARKIPQQFGGSYNYGRPDHCHTFEHYVPAKEFAKTHPEYFSLSGGKRATGLLGGQLCLTNPELVPLFVEKLLAYIAQDREDAKKSGQPVPTLYDISQNDNLTICECESCKAAVDKMGQSGLLLTFLNSIAEQVIAKYPDVFITTLAYHFTEPLPKIDIQAHPNIVVKLTNTKTNRVASLLDPQNTFFKEAVEQWSKICSHLMIWEYSITFNKFLIGMPYASERYYDDQYQHYANNKVMGIFAEHEFPEKADMFELKFFLEAKLMEDPFQDVKKLTDLFMEKYYGPTAKYMQEYRQILDDATRAADAQLRWHRDMNTFDYMTEDIILKCQKLFDDAVAAAQGDELLIARLMRARLGLDKLTCLRTCSVIHHNAKAENTSRLDGRSAFERMDHYWPIWCNRYPGHEKWKNPISDDLNQFRYFFNPPPVPKAFAKRSCYEFVAVCSARGDHDVKNIWASNEEDSEVGRAFRIKVEGSEYYNMPFAFGLYDNGKKATIAKATFDSIPDYPGYNWFRLGDPIVIPEDTLLFINRAWTIQLQFNGYKEIVGKKFEIWISAKHQGQQFHPFQKPGADRIMVDRILLVEP